MFIESSSNAATIYWTLREDGVGVINSGYFNLAAGESYSDALPLPYLLE